MPASATITSTDLSTFVSGTVIKSAKMNTNFSIWRGHNIPVDASASAAANNSYDLGSTDYRWRYVYGKSVPVIVSTTGSMSITSSVDIVLMNTTAATTTANLPSAVGFYGTLTIKNIGTGGKTVFIDGNGAQTIDATITANLVDLEVWTLVSDQSNWWSI